MKIQIVTPAPKGTTLGNRVTANRWAKILRQLGHRVDISINLDGMPNADLMIALHATRSHRSILNWKASATEKPMIVCLTGTDLHVNLQSDPNSRPYGKAKESLQLADHVVLLEPEGIKCLTDKPFRKTVRAKSTVIFQSATPVKTKPPRLKTRFEVSVIGHLREVKDPFRAAEAAARLPTESKIRIVHLGGALNSKMRRKAEALQKSNIRYQWLGPRPHAETMQRLTRSRLTVLTSLVEGAPGVISEAIINHVPILATRIPASVGLLGKSYPGLFPVGDTNQLAKMLYRVECDATFRNNLVKKLKILRPQFELKAEVKSWKNMLGNLGG